MDWIIRMENVSGANWLEGRQLTGRRNFGRTGIFQNFPISCIDCEKLLLI